MKMKLHFNPDLDFQHQAINAVCDLFRGQELCQTEFTVTHVGKQPQRRLTDLGQDLGAGNRLGLSDEQILNNLQAIQLRNRLPRSDSLQSKDFTVEMETGTGKTYVYLRTIFELNKRYGFLKFVIVVPSIAIKEGVYKSLQITEDHFRTLYSGIPLEYFLYDSTKLGQVRNFAASSQIQIMIMTVGAINKKDINNLYKDSEKTGGEKPIDLIKATQPVLIVDEPQSVDGGLEGRGKKALGAMRPACTLRYSATHADTHHMVYRLDAIDAYERKLVKQIEVASATIEDTYNKPYVRLIATDNRHGSVRAKVEIDVEEAGIIRRSKKFVHDGDSLEQKTNRSVYRNFRVGEICVKRNADAAFMELFSPDGGNLFLKPGEAYNDINALPVHREMIRRTIREHLDKEKRLHPHGIKVLSLFFIDKVEKYRSYDGDGNHVKGEYARIFEQEYQRLTQHPDYHMLFKGSNIATNAENVHNGYFSLDRKNRMTNTSENNQTSRENAERAYNLIMRDKEKLLSLDTPLKFIFSHSALREGWDNPNVFQICVLRDIQTERERRQTVGRGLRLCVNQQGERLHNPDVNTLTIVAMESYQEFAENLQREVEKDTGVRFGIIEMHRFAAIPITDEDGNQTDLGDKNSKVLWNYLKSRGFIGENGQIQDKLRTALKEKNFNVPHAFTSARAEIIATLHKLAGRLEIKNADERKTVRPRQAVLESPEFKSLWDRIKYKTTYQVTFDNQDLITRCIKAIKEAPSIPTTQLQWRKADIDIDTSGVKVSEKKGAATVSLTEVNTLLPDVLTELQDRTQLTRRSIQRILSESGRLNDLKRNPQRFLDLVARAINNCKQQVLVDGIKYQRLGDEHYYAQKLFETEELTGYLKNMIKAEKSVYSEIVYESDTEASFADQLENHTAVKVYAKLPRWFKVPTPLGTYTPDWAILFDTGESERLYFVVETKASTFPSDLRDVERGKIVCGRAHFKALKVKSNPARYELAVNVHDLLAQTAH